MSMAKTAPFEKYAAEYDQWFVKNDSIYLSELQALQSLLPQGARGLEVGVGSGRFAFSLDIGTGIEPAEGLARIARNRGITVYRNVAEQLPFGDAEFDFVLFVTVICFLDDVEKAFREACRVLKNNGSIIVGFLDKTSSLGRAYQQRQNRSTFMKDARLYKTDEVASYLKKTGFTDCVFKQTLFSEKNTRIEPVRNGFGQGAFVVVKARKGAYCSDRAM